MGRALLLYHFYEPDPVVSAVHFAQLGRALAARGWEVEAWPSNRLRRSPRASLPGRGREGPVAVRRAWRPPLSQDRVLGRVLNTAWTVASWALRSLCAPRPDLVVVGTDPPLSVVSALAIRLRHPRAAIVHWCFDVYPGAAAAEGRLRTGSLAHRALAWAATRGLRACDAIVDIGPCMREGLEAAAPGVAKATLVPWSSVEAEGHAPPDPALRRRLFGDARAVLLYAGRLGKAHAWEAFVRLARALEPEGVVVAFQAVGEREGEIRVAAAGVPSVRFLPGCAAGDLLPRLGAADLHLVSLRPEWSGLVVPSKFFAALAAGRPVVYDGPAASSVARWVLDHDLGVVLEEGGEGDDPARVRQAVARSLAGPAWGAHCHAVERERFSREAVLRGFDEVAAAALARRQRRVQ